MASSHPDLRKYERVLNRYFRISPSERKTGERQKVLKFLGIGNPREFLGVHIPLWEARIDEFLDPYSTDMLPSSISHIHVNWVRDAIRTMPAGARVMIFSSKLKATGLKPAVLDLLKAMTGEEYADFEVVDVQLIHKIHKDTAFIVRTPDRKEHSLYLSHFGCQGEYIYSGLPGLVGLPAVPVVYLVTPQEEEVLLKPEERGVNIHLEEGITAARILRDAAWWVEGAARQDALGDCVGTAFRYGHYVATPEKKVVMIDNTELFHPREADARMFEPIHEYLSRKAFPGDAGKRERLRKKLQEDYGKAYSGQMGTIRGKFPEIERYLAGMHRLVRSYTGEPFENVAGRVKARISAGTRR